MEYQAQNDLEDEVMKSKLGTYRYCINECMACILTNPLRISSWYLLEAPCRTHLQESGTQILVIIQAPVLPLGGLRFRSQLWM